MAKQTESQEIIGILQELVAKYEQESKKSADDFVQDVQATQEWFQHFVEKHAVDLVGLVHRSALDPSDKVYFMFLIFHGLFQYEQYIELQEKLERRSNELQSAKDQVEAEITELEAKKQASFEAVLEHLKAANKAFIELQESTMKKGMKQMEAAKRAAEVETMEEIKQKLKKK